MNYTEVFGRSYQFCHWSSTPGTPSFQSLDHLHRKSRKLVYIHLVYVNAQNCFHKLATKPNVSVDPLRFCKGNANECIIESAITGTVFQIHCVFKRWLALIQYNKKGDSLVKENVFPCLCTSAVLLTMCVCVNKNDYHLSYQ